MDTIFAERPGYGGRQGAGGSCRVPQMDVPSAPQSTLMDGFFECSLQGVLAKDCPVLAFGGFYQNRKIHGTARSRSFGLPP